MTLADGLPSHDRLDGNYFEWLKGLLRQRNSLMMENLALRHQLMVLKRNRPKSRFTEPVCGEFQFSVILTAIEHLLNHG